MEEKLRHLHVWLIEILIKFDYTEDDEKLLLFWQIYSLSVKFYWCITEKNPYFVQLTSQSDRLIAINWVRSIKTREKLVGLKSL
jgi:hypothetical protein